MFDKNIKKKFRFDDDKSFKTKHVVNTLTNIYNKKIDDIVSIFTINSVSNKS